MAKNAKMFAGGIGMYRHEDCEQLKLELPFGVTLQLHSEKDVRFIRQ
jgi:hypothetical protein